MGSPELRTAAVALLVAAVMSGCKPPRSPREAAEGKVTGEWVAEPEWRIELREEDGGRISGSGRAGEGTFRIEGIRGESSLTLRFRGGGEPVHYRGGLAGPRTIAGELQLPRDTVLLTFTRR